MKTVAVFGDPNRPGVLQALARFCRFAKGKVQIQLYHMPCEDQMAQIGRCQLAFVFGGDGTIISAARLLSKVRIPVVGVNLGKLGYLAEFSLPELREVFDQVIGGRVPIERRMMLACSVASAAGGEPGRCRFRANAVNDVFVHAGPPFRVIELELFVDGQRVARFVSDGLIVASPTGSTAYNLSAGGPILQTGMKALVITAICPHSLSFRPIVIDADKRIEIRAIRLNEGTTLAVDGQVRFGLGPGDFVRVTRARQGFLVVSNPLRANWQTLATKLGWSGHPRYHADGQ